MLNAHLLGELLESNSSFLGGSPIDSLPHVGMPSIRLYHNRKKGNIGQIFLYIKIWWWKWEFSCIFFFSTVKPSMYVDSTCVQPNLSSLTLGDEFWLITSLINYVGQPICKHESVSLMGGDLLSQKHQLTSYEYHYHHYCNQFRQRHLNLKFQFILRIKNLIQ